MTSQELHCIHISSTQEVSETTVKSQQEYREEVSNADGYIIEGVNDVIQLISAAQIVITPNIGETCGMGRIKKRPDIRSRNFLTAAMSIPHYEQTDDWDCGITSALMIVNALASFLTTTNDSSSGDEMTASCVIRELSHEYLSSLYPGKSTWTIDILDMLRRHGIEATLCTSVWGVDEGLKELEFYTFDDQFENDTIRVNALFDRYRPFVYHGKACLFDLARTFACATTCPPPSSQIENPQRVLGQSNTRLIESLPYRHCFAAIILVDWTKLSCLTVDHVDCCHSTDHNSCEPNSADDPTSSEEESDFAGHYIVLTSSRACGKCSSCTSGDLCMNPVFTYHNPSQCHGHCELDLASLSKAWDTYGTDHDLIVVRYPE